MWSRPIILLLLICVFNIAMAAKKPKPAKPKQFTAQFEVTAKGKDFKCKITLLYKEQKGTLVVDKKKSKVSCSPDAKGNFGAVQETFEIGGKSVEVTILIKKGKDTITGVSVTEETNPGPATTTGGPGGAGVTGGPGGSGVTGGPGVAGGAMTCSCKAPLLPTEMFPGNAIMGRMADMAVSGRKLAGSVMASSRGGNQGKSRSSLAPLTGSPLESLLWLGLVSALAALAAYGKVTLLENLGLLTGPPIPGRSLAAGQETPLDKFSSPQSFLTTLFTEETENLSAMSQSLTEALEQQMADMDVEAMMDEAVTSLGSDLGQIASSLQGVMENMPPMESPSMDLDCTCVPAA